MSPSRSRPRARDIFFDDEPIESVLYGEGSPGPSNASVWIGVDAETDAITAGMAGGDAGVALRQMERLLSGSAPVPSLDNCAKFCSSLRKLIPVCPRPVLSADATACGPVLRALVEVARRYEAGRLQCNAETLLYRWYEGRDEYEQARSIVAAMQRRAEAQGNKGLSAILTNNYGYEFLLEGNAADAEPHFMRAAAHFERMDIAIEIVNVRANILTCRLALLSPNEWEELIPEVTETNRRLLHLGDWRVRKTMHLLAEMALARGRTAAAVRWARRAVSASSNVPTRLRHDDEQYLLRLEQRL